MKAAFHRQETGAMLAQVLLLIVLLLFVGLAIDGGNAYFERRHMQNAADAGALAGARALCYGGDPVAEATDYAVNRNSADTALVEVNGNKVRVVASCTRDTYFMGLGSLLGGIGIDVLNISAEATAACGETTRLCGAFPVAFDEITWDTIPCGAEFYVWDDDSVTDDMCDKCDCESVIGSAISIGPGHRGWVRLPPPPEPWPNPAGCKDNCGADALKCWIENDYSGPIDIGDCVPGDPGVVSSALQAAEKREGDNIYVLIWGPGPCNEIIGECPGTPYHIVDFGYVNLVDVNLKLTIPPLPGHDQNECPKNAKVMRARRLCDPQPIACGRTEGAPPDEFIAVSLIQD
jgi:hypothetical protein